MVKIPTKGILYVMDKSNDKSLEILTTKEAYSFFEEYEGLLCEITYLDNGYLKSVIPLNKSSIEFGYNILGELYRSNFVENTQIILDNKNFNLNDEDLDREYYHFALTKEMLVAEFPTPGLLKEIIQKNKITDITQFHQIARTKFSGLMEFNEHWELIDYYFKPDNNGFILKHALNEVVYNRFIDHNITVSHSTNITFINCVFMKDIIISDSSKICIHGCIVKGSVYLMSNVEYPIFLESIINELNISYAKINELQLSENNIWKLIIISSTIENCIWKWIRVDFFTTENSLLPKEQINISLINVKNIRRKSYSKEFRREKNFFINFYTYNFPKKKLGTQKNVACLSTVNFLLENAILNTDKNLICDLKYKKSLYSVQGIKKGYIFLTGGYYKPMRFFLYFLLLNSIMVFLFTLPFNCFILNDSTKVVINGLSLEKSIQYCLDLLFNINIFEYSAYNISHILSVGYKSLNTIFVAGFFASLLKKYIES